MSKRGRLRWLFWVGAFLVLLGVLIWFAPALIVNSSLGQSIISQVIPGLRGELTIGSAGLDWLSPLRIANLTVRSRGGEQILHVAALTSEKTLAGLVLDPYRAGTLRASGLELTVVLGDATSNVEETLKPSADRQRKKPSPPMHFTLEIVDSRVVVTDVLTTHEWSIDNLRGRLQAAGKGITDLELQASGDVLSAGRSGRVEAQMANGQLHVKTDRLPLEVAEGPLRRFAGSVQLAGLLSSDIQCRWLSADELTASGRVEIDGLSLVAPSLLAEDVVHMASATAEAQIRLEGRRLTAQLLTLNTDVGQLQASGSVELADFSAAALWKALRDEDLSLRADVDLARMSQLLPSTLRIRDGVEIVSGRAQMTVSSERINGWQQWQGRLETTNLTAREGERHIIWEQPVTLSLASRVSDAGFVVDQLACESDFLEITGKGEINQASFSMDCDLTRLSEQLGQFVSLHPVQLAGNVTARCTWQSDREDQINFSGDLLVTEFQLDLPDRPPWHDARMEILLRANGLREGPRLRKVNAAALTLTSGKDRLDLQLANPVTLAPADASRPGSESNEPTEWPVRLSLQGNLATWMPRIGPWFSLEDSRLRGAASFQAVSTISSTRMDVSAAELDVSHFIFRQPGRLIREPSLKLNTVGTWSIPKRQWVSKDTTLVSSTISARASDVSVEFTDATTTPRTSGQVAFRADLARLSRWFHDPEVKPSVRFLGQLTGRVMLNHEETSTRADWTAELNELVVQRASNRKVPAADSSGVAVSRPARWESTWNEPQITLAGQGDYDHSADKAQLNSLQVRSQLLAFAAVGKVENAFGRLSNGDGATSVTVPSGSSSAPIRFIDLSGQVKYDLDNLTQFLQSYLGDGIRISGIRQSDFSIQGPVATHDSETGHSSVAVQSVPTGLIAQSGIGWSTANVYGMEIGAGQLNVRLAEGILDVSPLDVAVSDGRLRIGPRIFFNRDPQLLVVQPGKLLDRVQITPQMCATWLKFVAPMIAHSTEIEGRLSTDLAHAQLPLSDPMAGDLEGVVTIHSARLQPSAATEPFVSIATQIGALVRRRPPAYGDSANTLARIDNREIPFQVTQGRVYHRGMHIIVRDVELRSSGSVGFDQTLDLVVEVPILEDWVSSDKNLSSLAGQVIRFPVRGTLSRPELDRQSMTKLTRQLLRAPVQQAIEEQVIKGLDRLFRP